MLRCLVVDDHSDGATSLGAYLGILARFSGYGAQTASCAAADISLSASWPSRSRNLELDSNEHPAKLTGLLLRAIVATRSTYVCVIPHIRHHGPGQQSDPRDPAGLRDVSGVNAPNCWQLTKPRQPRARCSKAGALWVCRKSLRVRCGTVTCEVPAFR